MTQQIDFALWNEFQQEQERAIKNLEVKAKTINSGKKPTGKWTQRIVEKVKISELASEFEISSCPEGHSIYFDDSIGCFCCAYVKFKVRKCFSGNIVDFMQFYMDGKND